MLRPDLDKFFKYFSQNKYLVSKAPLDGKIPEYPWRDYLLPQTEKLVDFKSKKERQLSKLVLFGVHLVDLKAMTLLDLVFEKDKNYQLRKEKTIIVGYAKIGFKDEFAKWQDKYEEDVLEHVKFDIFIEIGPRIRYFSGSKEGQKILEKLKIKYQHIEFSGAVREGELDGEMVRIKKALEKSYNKKLWQELGEKCLACGKCAIVCPTCFCFRVFDSTKKRSRSWDSCFYNEFTRVAGGHEFADEIEKKIYFWYIHKFVRIPHEFQVSGCVKCGRCIKICPVGIDVHKNIKKILKS